MTKDKNTTPNSQYKIRNRFVGFATLLLILALIAPWIITDKSNNQTSSSPILQPDIVQQQFQSIESTTDDNHANSAYGVDDIPYIPDNEQDLNSLISPDVAQNDINETTPSDNVKVSEQESKLYMIQIAALKNKKKIEELVALLRLNNYNVKVIPKNPEPNQLIKLQVGPYGKREQAEQVIDNLNSLTKQKSIIVAN